MYVRLATCTQSPPVSPRDIEHYYQLVGYPLKSLIRECSFGSRAVDCSSVSTGVFDADRGLCYLVSLPVNTTQTVAASGLSLVLSLDTHKGYTPKDVAGDDEAPESPLYDAIHMTVHAPEAFDPTRLASTLLMPG